jgi:hypothetical protein
MNTGKSVTFFGLFDLVSMIEIPILQRDYAQGRIEAIDVRSLFLSSLFDALTVSSIESHQSLDLDFVYGNFEGNDNRTFSVLDGQQRLTTLFLLHWFLALKNNRLCDFKARFVTKDGRSRFSYKTRPSTSEFFDAISSVQFEYGQNAISKQINNSQWFYSSWKQDPTVQSCLRMLDAIEIKFKDNDEDLYEKLINTDAPYITFQFLNLHSFGLSDELYIKMNARGKPLTPFENFKAWLFKKIEGMPKNSEFEHKIDQQWTDIFWQLSIKENAKFDEFYLKFFNLLAFYHNCEITKGSYVMVPSNEKLWLTNIRASSGYIPHSRLEQINAFKQKDINRVEKVLNFIVNAEHAGISNLFQTVVKTTSYLSQIRFYAFIIFVEKAAVIDDWNNETYTQLSRWLKVTKNLINNHRIDDLSSFILSIRSLNSISEHCLGIYEAMMLSTFKIAGFANEQWEEEIVKARLILSDNRWDTLLKKYEDHPYLKGKIGFILHLAHVDGSYEQTVFESYASKVAVLLSAKVLTSSKFQLQRALLTIDDYLIEDGYNRYSFGLPNNTTYRERSENWLNVVTGVAFKTLLDKVGGTDTDAVLLELQNIIDSDRSKGWRAVVIQNPEVIQYCSKRLIHRQGEQVSLLTKSTRRGYHAELNSYVLNLHLKKLSIEGKLPSEITLSTYGDVYGDETPRAIVQLRGKSLGICFKNGKFEVISKVPHAQYPAYLVDSIIPTPIEIFDLLVSVGINKEVIA